MSHDSKKSKSIALRYSEGHSQSKAERLTYVEDLLLRSTPEVLIVRDCMQRFGLTQNMARCDLREVWRAWRLEDERAEVADKRAAMKARIEALLVAAAADKQFSACVQFCRQLAKIDGLYAPTRISVEDDRAHGHEAESADEIRQRIAQILRERPDLANGKAEA
jgi:hypothetical protein